MSNARLLHLVVATSLLLASGATAALAGTSDAQATAVAVDDFSYIDTSGEPADQAAAHQRRLESFMAALRGEFGSDGRFQLVASSCAANCASDRPGFAERLRAASQDGANILVVGKIHKMSTLVQWARLAAIDTGSGDIVLEKLFTFRGDNDEAWQRAEAFVSEELRAGLAATPVLPTPIAAPARVKLAVFPFELDDTSASAETAGETSSDAKGLAETTDAIRDVLSQSGRYQMIDVGKAGAAGNPALHDCSGCDATIALGLGAEQSLVGVIRRVSRTEYIVGFQLRDTQSGKVIASADSGLRMGANYSWSRGARRLVRDHLLEDQQ